MKSTCISCVLVLALAASSCSDNKIDNTGLAARVGDHTLSLQQVAMNVPSSLHDVDSARFATAFINNWVEEQAVTLMAERYIPDTEAIDRMVEDYRRQLIMWEYRRAMIQKQPNIAPADSMIEQYYREHSSAMKLSRPIVKGLYIKIADDDKNLPEIKKLYRSTDIEDIDRLEKLIDRAVNYEYFRDTWTDWGLIETRIPAKELENSADTYPLTHDHLEANDDGYVYFLSINAALAAGSPIPLDYARANIVEALQRENSLSFDKTLRRQLLDQAMEQGIAEIYIPD